MKLILPFLVLLILSSCSQTIYIVRHAEKAIPDAGASQMMVSDPPLSEQGQQRALQLKAELEKETRHDLMAFVRCVSEYITKASGANAITKNSGVPAICAAGDVAPPCENSIATMPVSRTPDAM